MYVYCSCGHKHWGAYGAAGLLLTDQDRTGVVLQERSELTHHGGTWALIGGALEPGETPAEAALREAHEEEHLDRATVHVVRSFVGTDHPEWTYTYVLAETERPADPVLTRGATWESDGSRWVDLTDVGGLALHPSLRDDWRWLVEELTR